MKSDDSQREPPPRANRASHVLLRSRAAPHEQHFLMDPDPNVGSDTIFGDLGLVDSVGDNVSQHVPTRQLHII